MCTQCWPQPGSHGTFGFRVAERAELQREGESVDRRSGACSRCIVWKVLPLVQRGEEKPSKNRALILALRVCVCVARPRAQGDLFYSAGPHCNAVKLSREELKINDYDWTGNADIRARQKFLAMGERCVAIFLTCSSAWFQQRRL